MSKSFFLAGALCVASFVPLSSQATVQIPADGTIANYAILAEDLHDFHGGIFAESATRNVKVNNWQSEFKINRANAYLGYDVTRWLTIYALGGIASAKDSKAGVESDSSTLWGLGVWASLIDDDQIDKMWTFDRFRLNAGIEYAISDVCDQDYSEFSGFLTFSLVDEMFLDEGGMYPSSIAVFAGPVFNSVDFDDFDQVSNNTWGFTAGLSFTFSRYVYATVGYDWYTDDSIVYGSAGVRF